MKRKLALLLALTMLLSLAACGGGTGSAPTPAPSDSAAPAATATDTPAPTPEPTPEPLPELDPELQRAYDAGLLPEDWLGGMDKTITFAEYSEVCTALMKIWDESRLPEWREKVKLATASSDPMTIEHGYLMLSYLWVLLGYGEGHFESPYEQAPDDILPQMTWDYPLFPDWEDDVYLLHNSNYMWGGVQNISKVVSYASGETPFPYDRDKLDWHMQEAMSRDTAVRAAVRLAEGCGRSLQFRYIDIADAGTYDRTIITDELLAKPSKLPDPTQSKLPSEWKGAGYSICKHFVDEYKPFRKADIMFMADCGFNFTRLFFEFATLRHPEYPADGRLVNEYELKDLDRLVSWCIEYDIHLLITMQSYLDEGGEPIPTANGQGVPENDEQWALTTQYWEMLARRYADIPAKYLSFELSNEVEPHGPGKEATIVMMDQMIVHVAGIAEAIWAISPQRVVLYSQAGPAQIEWTERLAASGIAIARHPYTPGFLVSGDPEENPYGVPCWPQAYFPIGNVAEGYVPLTIRGEVAGAKLSFHIWNEEKRDVPPPLIEIRADGKQVGSIRAQPVCREDGRYYFDELYTVQLPADTKEVTVWVREHRANIDTVIVEGSAGKTVMIPWDVYDFRDYSDPLPLIVNPDGSYTNSENRMLDTDFLYETKIKPFRDVADKYGVGFIVDEFGIFVCDADWDIDTVAAYHDDMASMFEKYGIPWSYCEVTNLVPKHILLYYEGQEPQWSGATVGEVEMDGVTLRYVEELRDMICKHTLSN